MQNISSSLLKYMYRITSLLETKKGQGYLIALCFLIFIAASIYAGANATNNQMTNGDQFISAAIFSDIVKGTPLIASGHTNLMKLPILFIQGHLPQTYLTYASVNILLIILSVSLWATLISKIFSRKYVPILLLAFASTLIASPTFATDMSMSTIRNIEYPLALLFFYGTFIVHKKLLHNRKIIWSIFMIALLCVILISDKYFLYTLVPTCLITALVLQITHKNETRNIFNIVAIILLGTLASVLTLKILSLGNFISIDNGYASANHFIPFDSLLPSVLLTIKQTFELFGGLFFGLDIRKIYIPTLLSFGIALFAFYGVRTAYRKEIKSIKSISHIFLVVFLSLIYLSYIMPDFVATSNTRYLTGAIFILITYLSYICLQISDKYKLVYIGTCFILAAIGVMSIPQANLQYANTNIGIEKEIQRTKDTAKILDKYKIDTVVTAGGHYSLWFFSDRKINIVQLQEKCNTPSTWANNTSWIYSKNKSNSAFLVDRSFPETAARKCSGDEVIKIYGNPTRIIPVPKPDEAKVDITTFLYMYNYDIRSRLDVSNTP